MRRNVLTAVVIVFLCLILTISVFNIFKITKTSNDDNSAYTSREIVRGGESYYPRQDITTFMLLGIDRIGPAVSSNSYLNSGRADFIMLLVFDDKEKKVDVLHLNRDTMLNMQILGVGGLPAGSAYGQLALAHTYGTGLEDSCENTKKTISDFLYSLNIDYYASMSMDAISKINDSLGGVKVNVTDDFSAVTPYIPKGEVLLSGEQAIAFVRTRAQVGDQLNVSRMSRQEAYLKGIFNVISQKVSSNSDYLLQIYNEISDYIVTDADALALSNLANRFSQYSFGEIRTPAGDNVLGDEFMEFHVQPADLDNIILDLFYSKK